MCGIRPWIIACDATEFSFLLRPLIRCFCGFICILPEGLTLNLRSRNRPQNWPIPDSCTLGRYFCNVFLLRTADWPSWTGEEWILLLALLHEPSFCVKLFFVIYFLFEDVVHYFDVSIVVNFKLFVAQPLQRNCENHIAKWFTLVLATV